MARPRKAGSGHVCLLCDRKLRKSHTCRQCRLASRWIHEAHRGEHHEKHPLLSEQLKQYEYRAMIRQPLFSP